jgi:hypothetical protein
MKSAEIKDLSKTDVIMIKSKNMRDPEQVEVLRK